MIVESLGITGITLLILSLTGVVIWGLIWSAKNYAKDFGSYMFGGVKDWWDDFSGRRHERILKAGNDVNAFRDSLDRIAREAEILNEEWLTHPKFAIAWGNITNNQNVEKSKQIYESLVKLEQYNSKIQEGVLAVINASVRLDKETLQAYENITEKRNARMNPPAGSVPPPTYTWVPQTPPPAPAAPAASPAGFDWSRYTQANDDDRRNDGFLYNAKQSVARYPASPNRHNLYETYIQHEDYTMSPPKQISALDLVNYAEWLKPETKNGRWVGFFRTTVGADKWGRLIVTGETRRG